MENEEIVKELEENKTETDATEQKETTNTKEEKSPGTETEAKEEEANPDAEIGTEETPVDPVVPEQILEEQKPQYTTELVGNDNFTLEIAHQITAGDMLVSTLLAANIAVSLLCRLIRDRK